MQRIYDESVQEELVSKEVFRLEKFLQDCLTWEGPHARAEGRSDELTTSPIAQLPLPIPLCCSGRGDRRIIHEERRGWQKAF